MEGIGAPMGENLRKTYQIYPFLSINMNCPNVKYERTNKIYTAARRPTDKQVQVMPCNGSCKLDLSTSNDEINDLNIALERIKELEHQIAHNAAKLNAANKTNVKLLSDLYGHKIKLFSFVFLEYLC